MLKNFHPAQLTYIIESRRTAKYGNIATFALGISACVVCILPSHWSLKISNIAIASGLFITSHKLEKLQKWSDDYQHSTNHESIKGYGLHLNNSFAPPRREVAIADIAQPVKFADVKQALSKPHCMLLGSTGDGKSTLAKHLAANCTAYTIVIDPHAAPDDWGNLPVFGAGRKYSEIAKIMGVTLKLLQKRFEERDNGVKQFEPIIIICDEYPAIIASTEAGKVASSWMKLISREARKVSIRLVVLTQSPEVKAIGLEGEGSVRDNFCFIRLGEFALDHAKSLKDEQIKSAIESADRPAMLGNLPCAIPQLSDRLAMPVLSMPIDYQELIDSPHQLPIAPPSVAIAAQPQSTAIAPIFTKIINYLDGRDWTRDNVIKQSITDFKNADTPIEELQGYLQFLEVQGYLETRNAGRNGLEAKKI